MAYKILVAEDDIGLNQGIRLALQREEFIFDMAYTLKETWEKWRKENPDMVILDVNFPDGNGFDFLRMLRQSSDIPVIVVTANDMETDEVTGLTLGADDYITKPFSLMALRIRVENIWKRTRNNKIQIYEEAGYMFDFGHLDFKVNGQEISLSAPEQKLLKLFITHPGQTLPRDILVENIWTCSMEYVDENALSVTISRLRKKLEIKGKSSPVSTVYGIGYAWKHQGD
ncbi:MAG: response regulator transcription factor [Lachnospiraceae bacterium]|nr:response regulator transcription factor [Lachnospiraceae bacterium]MDE7052535.1 response regulator transcription factor [Lachnospiraceae bacterium]